jgi:hypothetical protein
MKYHVNKKKRGIGFPCDIIGEIVPLNNIAEVNDTPVTGKICLLTTGLGGVAQRNHEYPVCL